VLNFLAGIASLNVVTGILDHSQVAAQPTGSVGEHVNKVAEASADSQEIVAVVRQPFLVVETV
jgi:hypothetical protein